MIAFADQILKRRNLIRFLPLYGGLAGAVVTAAGILSTSRENLETLVWTSGLAALVPAAAPPLGTTGRIVLSIGGGLLVGALLWSALYLLVGPGGFLVGRTRPEAGVPVIRRADAHPDAPPRRPMSAADLGTPMMEVGVGVMRERAIPVDLDLPMAAFDPKAILPVPMAPTRPVSSLAPPAMIEPVIEADPAGGPVVERVVEPSTFVTLPSPRPIDAPATPIFETAAPSPVPTPIARPPREPTEPTTPPTIEALLRRLEHGARRRGRIGSH